MPIRQRNADVFPDPEAFDPSRWIGHSAEETRARERCLVAFGRGSRNCLGQNVAMAQIYCTFAALFYRFDDLQVCSDFKRKDLEVADLLFSYPRRGAARFKITRRTAAV